MERARMTVEDAQKELDNLHAQQLIALCRQSDIDAFIARLGVIWHIDVQEIKDESGRRKGYKAIDMSWEH